VIEIAAAAVAWLGACLIVLADGRLGLALGLGLVTAGLSVFALQSGAGIAAAAVALGGATASYQRFRSGPTGWRLMPPDSTPRLVLCLVAGLIGLWFAASVAIGPGGSLRFAATALTGMLGIRIVTSPHSAVVLTAVGGLALSVAVAAGLESGVPGPAACIAAGLIAAGATLIRDQEPRAA
jgi:hypothetical protein